MSHIHDVDDLETGDIIDRHWFCSDSCHQFWCRAAGVNYGGWNGCHELVSDTPVPCYHCGDALNVVPDVGDES
jgi:hypothetical protein